jgi:protein MpaA
MTAKNKKITSLDQDARRLAKAVVRSGKSYSSRLTKRHLLQISGALFLLFIISYTIHFFTPRTVTFSYAHQTCFTNPSLLPETLSRNRNSNFKIEPKTTLAVLGYPVYSQVSCLNTLQAPKANASSSVSYGNTIVRKAITINAPSRPTIKISTQLTKPVPVKDPLLFSLTQTDKTFTYQLSTNGRHVPCLPANNKLRCDVAALQLTQSTTYTFAIERLFRDKAIETVFQRDLKTVDAVRVTGADLTSGQMVYDIRRDMTITLDKSNIKEAEPKLYQVVNNERKEVPTTHTIETNTIKVHFTNELPRNANFELILKNTTAADGGYLMEPYSAWFRTSGGPKVSRVSIGKSRVSPNATVTITFDSNVSAQQAVGNFARLEANGSVVTATVSVRANTISIKPTAALPKCAVLTVKVLDGLKNEFGVSGGSAWQYSSRVLCQSVFSIGTSVKGRSITAYSFGNGPSKIVFVGGTHGNERSSVSILNSWIDYLENNPNRIPAHRTIIVIPVVNPDGYAANTRTNANNVDLNRNFPSNSWKAGVTMPDHSYLATGGGTAPLSEPESRALANFVLAQRPRLVLTYHAAGNVVVPNDSGDSNAIARTYDRNSSVGFMSNSGTPTFFEYDTTGAFEDWLHDKPGVAALLIELRDKTSNEFSRHQNAFWYVAGL